MEEYGGRANSGVMLLEFDTGQVQGFLTVMLANALTLSSLTFFTCKLGINLVIMKVKFEKCNLLELRGLSKVLTIKLNRYIWNFNNNHQQGKKKCRAGRQWRGRESGTSSLRSEKRRDLNDGIGGGINVQKTEFTKRTRVIIWKKNRRSQESRRGRKTLSSIP